MRIKLPALKDDQKIPLFSSWRGWYLFVISVLLLLVAFFTWFTQYFS